MLVLIPEMWVRSWVVAEPVLAGVLVDGVHSGGKLGIGLRLAGGPLLVRRLAGVLVDWDLSGGGLAEL
jgi:hypothetical protein